MKTTIGAYDRTTKSVPVTFEYEGVTHDRAVNAVLKADGTYDRKATIARVDDVARGVAQKIAVGAIRSVEVAEEAPPAPDGD